MSTVTSTPTATSWETFRILLEEMRRDCVAQRELAVAEAATSVPDPVAVRRVTSLLQTIDEIDAALDRIAEGSYGRCGSCGVALPLERLEFRPYAAGCVTCQSSVA
jgi:DnaK suppressor protein